MFEFSREKPIYLQIAEWLENEILKGNIREGGRLPSHKLVDVGFQRHAQVASELQIPTGFVPAGTTGQGRAAGSNGQNKREGAMSDVH